MQLDLITRAGAIFVGATYASGFVTLALHHAQFGISQFSPLKPRIFSAGLLFLLLALAPALSASRFFGLLDRLAQKAVSEMPKGERVSRTLSAGAGFYSACFGLAFFTQFLFSDPLFIPYLPFLAMVATAVLYASAGDVLEMEFRTHPVRATVFMFLLSVLLFVTVLLFSPSMFLWLTLWYYAVGIGTVLMYHAVRDPSQAKRQQWEQHAIILVVVLLLYATGIYGRIRPMFGGGDPAPVVLHLSSKSPLSESLTLSVLLVDETEEGYYVLTKAGERRAYFLRRDLVSVVEFGRGDQDSPARKR